MLTTLSVMALFLMAMSSRLTIMYYPADFEDFRRVKFVSISLCEGYVCGLISMKDITGWITEFIFKTF